MFWIALALIVISSSYFSFQRERLKQESKSFNINGSSAQISQKFSQLKEENKQLEKRIQNLECIISDRKDYIDIEYEKEQSRLDNDQQKFRY